MRVLLVTSEITYIPHNYLELFQTLLQKSPDLVHGILFLKNFDLKTFKSILGLTFLGANKVRNTLLSNMFQLPLKRREQLFQKHQKKIFYASTMNSTPVFDWVKKEKIDLIINLRTRCIYKKEILSIPKLGCLNIHHGLLPEYRGTMCDLYALSEDREAGFTLHKMNEKIDDGEILIREVVDSGLEKNYLHYLSKSSRKEGEVLANFLIQLSKDQTVLRGTPNRSDKVIYTKNPTVEQIKQMKQKGMII